MADSDPGERNYDNMLKMLSDLNKDLEKLLEEMEKISGRLFPPLISSRSNSSYTSELKSAALTRSSLSTAQLLRHVVTTLPQSWTLPPKIASQCFLITLCVSVSYLCDWTLLRAETVISFL